MDYKNILINITILTFIILIFYLIYRKNRFRKIINEGFVDKQNSSNKKYRLIGIDENFYVYTKENLSSEWVSIPNNSRMLSITQINSGIFWAVGRDWNFKGSSILYHFLTRDNIISPKTVFKTVLSGYRGINICVAPDGNKLYAIGADGLLYISNENHTGFSNAGVPNPGGVIMNQLFLKDNTLHGVGRNNKIYKLVGNNFEYATIYNKIPITGASQLDDGTFLCASNTKLYQWVNNEWSDRGINNNKKIFYLSPMIGGTPQNKDCEYTEGNWSECDQPCGPGKQTKTNTIKAQAIGLGKACPKEQESKECKIKDCDKDCVYTESNWSECDKACGIGKQTKTFTIKSEGSGKGKSCPKNPLSKDCKIKDCEIECNYGNWTNVGECDKPCGPGKQKQKRINIPKSWPELRLRDVNFFNNNKTKAFNFIKSGNTSDEGKAPEIRDTRQKVRSNYPDGYTWWRQGWGDPDFYVRVISEQGNTVTVRTVNTNELITWARKEQLDPYNLVFEVTGNDIWNLYNQQLSAYVLYYLNKYSANSGSTNVIGPNGNFNLSFNRNGNNVNLNFYNTSREIRDEGEYANAGKTEAICKPEEKTLDCKLKECPVNCSLTDWTNDGQCSKPCGPGKQKQVRTRNSARNGGDDSCSNELIREIDCKIKDCPPPVDCRVTDWRNEGNCSAPCGGGKQKQIRDRYPGRDGGKDNCPTDLTREINCNTQPCPKDCVIKNWKDTSTCSATCGGGVKSEQLEVIEPTGNGAPCPAIRTRQIRCNDKPCPVDCKYSANWEQLQWSKCDKTCGGGTQKKVRTIVTQAAYGGKACSEPLEITQQCNTQPCPIDCKVSSWTDWTQCSKFCGTGKKESTRTIIIPAQFGGAACPTDLKKEENCNTMPCSDLDCVVSDWAETTCSAPCGPGTKTRTRTVIREPKPGGQGCPILREVVPCNNEPCPIDCKVSDWNTPPCPVKCGGSKIKRTRTILVPQAGRGAPCPPLEENIFCNTEPCAVDCVVSNWSEWSQCNKTCGGGVSKRTRTIVKPSQHKGAQCPILEESKPCNSQPCPVNCKLSEWDNWSKCTKECGGGTKTRTRTVVTKPQFGGDGCSNLIENDNCNTQPCPIDCKVGEWENWSDCTKECGTGTTTRKRQVLIEPKFGGKICPILEETKDCNTQNCQIDCKVSDWNEWAKCTKSCDGGVTSRSRKIIEPNAYGGKECPPIFESKKCNTFPCPINCEVSGWSRYSKCSKSCGGGTKVKTRTITQIPQFNGEKCPPLQDIQPCNTQPCPVDCQLSDWGPWTECSKECKGGFKSRSKVVMVKPQFDGEECPPMTETVPCNEDIPCIVDCKVSTWSPWSQCTKQCGTGTRTRTRNVITQPTSDGEPCPKLTEIQKCNSQPCPVNCVVSAWSEFTKCSKQCGGGTQTRYRTIITPSAFGGKECPALTETISCNTNGCPVNCQVSNWGPFTDCSADCNGGIKKRKRKILVDPKNGGEPCPNLTESVPCNTHSCPIDCVVSQWGEWGDCSKECGPSERRRIRKVLVPPKGGGKPCPILTESKRCNTLPCPIDCEVSNWGEWSKCDKECGGGNQERRRRILIEPKLGGKDCPPLSQRRKCNTEKC